MTTPDNKKGERSRDEVLAGEYVLGVLPFAERLRVEKRIRDDRNFASIVDRWQSNLSGFNESYAAEAAPPPWMYKAIEAQLFEDTASRGSAWNILWNSVLLWRGVALTSLAAALFLAGNASGIFSSASEPVVLAKLGAANSNISLVTYYDSSKGTLRITPAAAGEGDKKSLELWLIDGDKAPVALGVMPDSGDGSFTIPPSMRSGLKDGVTLAVSLEPHGGSPTGKPTGPVIASGVAGSI
jgi:anti-sigma-K factor RskA